MSTNRNAPLGSKGAIITTSKSNYTKKFPPYGKKLDDLRKRGLIPNKRVIVATDWRIGKLFPRIIVTPDTPVASLKFNYLAGLHVQIVYFDHDNHMENLITEIVSIQPAVLATFNMDAVKAGKPAFKLVFSQSVMEAA